MQTICTLIRHVFKVCAFLNTTKYNHYCSRTPLVFSRDGTAGPKLNVPVLQIVGADSAFVDDTVEVNARLNPADSEWLKVGKCFVFCALFFYSNY